MFTCHPTSVWTKAKTEQLTAKVSGSDWRGFTHQQALALRQTEGFPLCPGTQRPMGGMWAELVMSGPRVSRRVPLLLWSLHFEPVP